MWEMMPMLRMDSWDKITVLLGLVWLFMRQKLNKYSAERQRRNGGNVCHSILGRDTLPSIPIEFTAHHLPQGTTTCL
jgi:hypothetical protein